MNDPEHEMTRNIMRRVRVIYYLRRLSSPLALEIFVLVACTVAINYSVSITHVVTNASHHSHILERVDYLVTALIQTEFFVQVMLGAVLLVVILMSYGIYKNLRGLRVSEVRTSIGL